jgi:hypothetical protein
MKKNNKNKISEAGKLKKSKKEVEEANVAIQKAKKEIREAEKATSNAQEEVIDVAIISKGNKRKNLSQAARDLEKATHLAAESCQSTEEAEFRLKRFNQK